MIVPGNILGVMGGGQLGRMFALAARRMGYRIHVFDPTPGGPAGQAADLEMNTDYADEEALAGFARGVSAVTFEFENIPARSLEALARVRPVHPHPEVLLTCQHREREKTFLSRKGYPLAPFAVVDSAASLREGLRQTGVPAVLKTAAFGYDGKGQTRVSATDSPEAIWHTFGADRAVLEAWIEHDREISVICAGSPERGYTCFPAAENIHTRHILDVSILPARAEPDVLAEAAAIARSIAGELRLTGLVAVEFFLPPGGRLLVNELAPRPHNSGHATLEACVTSQFEQQVRTLCGIPTGSPRLLCPAVMVNLLGDLWGDGEPDWSPVLREPAAKLHLYGKEQARPGRKMGHVTVLDPDAETAVTKAFALRRELGIG